MQIQRRVHHAPVHNAPLFAKPRNGNSLRVYCQTNAGIKCSICARNSAVKMEETAPFPTTWMNLKDVTINEISQTKKNTVIPFICEILKSWEAEGRMEEMSLVVEGYKPSVRRWINSGDLTYSPVTTVDYYMKALNLLRVDLVLSQKQKKKITMWSETS